VDTIITNGRSRQFGLPWLPLRAIQQWRRHNRTAAILARLDDRMLRDIGIDRSAIPSAARQLGTRPEGC
jgi:uncharacterized protein YjiS (DUF1127 family)